MENGEYCKGKLPTDGEPKFEKGVTCGRNNFIPINRVLFFGRPDLRERERERKMFSILFG